MEKKICRKIYSLNKLAYLLSNGVDVDLQIQTDDEGHKKVYGVVHEDIKDIIDAYYADKKLHSFINMFNVIRGKLKEV